MQQSQQILRRQILMPIQCLQNRLQLLILLFPINLHILDQIRIFLGDNHIGLMILFFGVEIITEIYYLKQLGFGLLGSHCFLV